MRERRCGEGLVARVDGGEWVGVGRFAGGDSQMVRVFVCERELERNRTSVREQKAY